MTTVIISDLDEFELNALRVRAQSNDNECIIMLLHDLNPQHFVESKNRQLLDELIEVVAAQTHLHCLRFTIAKDVTVLPQALLNAIETIIAKNHSIFDYQFEYIGHDKTTEHSEHDERVAKSISNNLTFLKKMSTYDHAREQSAFNAVQSVSQNLFTYYTSIPIGQPPPPVIELIGLMIALRKRNDWVANALVIRSLLHTRLIDLIHSQKYPDGELAKSLERSIMLLDPLLIKQAAASKRWEWECFLSNSTSLSGAWSDKALQRLYALYTYKNVMSGIDYVSRNMKTITAKDLYQYLAERRQQLAIHLNQKDKNYLGVPRTKNFGETAISQFGRYADFYFKFKDRLQTLFETGACADYAIASVTAGKDKSRSVPAVIVKTDDGMDLCRLTFKYQGEGEGIAEDTVYEEYGECPHINPGDHKNIETIFAKIEPFFQAILTSREPTVEAIEHLASMARFLCPTMPSARGSAAVIEKFIYVMMYMSGFPLVPYEGSMPLDLEMISEPNPQKSLKIFKLILFPELLKFCLQAKLKATNSVSVANMIQFSGIYTAPNAKIKPDLRPPLLKM